MTQNAPSFKNIAVSFSSVSEKEKLVSWLVGNYSAWLGGFRTLREIAGGQLNGFILKRISGEESLLASTSIFSKTAFNKYGVDLSVLENEACAALSDAFAGGGKIALMDELGPITALSSRFSETALQALLGPGRCLVFYRKGAKAFEDTLSRIDGTLKLTLSDGKYPETKDLIESWIEDFALEVKEKK